MLEVNSSPGFGPQPQPSQHYPQVARRISDDERNMVISRVQIHSTPEAPAQLRLDDVARYEMLPRYHVSVPGREVYLAERLFRAGAHRLGIIGYVQEDENPRSPYVARTFYLSNSQAVFRYLPGIVGGWVHKGYDEQSVTLPPILQAAIFQVRVEGRIRPVAEADDQRRMLQGASRLEPRHLASPGADADLTAKKVVQREARRIDDRPETEGTVATLPQP